MQIYLVFLKTCMRHPGATLLSAVVLLFLTLILSLTMNVRQNREVESDRFDIYVMMHTGSTLEHTDKIVKVIEERLHEIPEKQDVVSRVQEEQAVLTVILRKDYETTGRRKIAEIKADAQARMPAVGGAEISFSEAMSGSGGEDGAGAATLYASYWTSNCHVANHLPFGTIFSPVQALPFRKDTCILFKASSGGKTAAKHNERIEAYRYVLTTRDQLYSITDIENFCRVTFGSRIQQVKARLGVSVSHKQKEGLIRTLDVCQTPSEGYRELLLDPVRQGELKEELEKRSPELYNYRIMIES